MPGVLETLLALDDQYQRDRQQSEDFLHRRDRRYGLDHPQRPLSAEHWLQQLQRFSGDTGVAAADPRLTLWRRIRWLMVVAGALLGLLTMAGLLFYDGGQQINVTLILGVVGLQLLLALVTALQGLFGWQPWRLLSDWLQQRRADISGAGLAPLRPQLMTGNAQAAGLAFAVMALLTLLVSVVIQDLAFGWSTTLATASSDYHRLVAALSWPWAGWLPAATPDLQLVADTRFFRLGDNTPNADAARWGAWWPFLAMTWLVYVVLPRWLLLLFARWHLQRSARLQLRRHPVFQALQWRAETPLLDTGSQTEDTGRLPVSTEGNLQPLPATRLGIRWAGAGDREQLTGYLTAPATLVRAGGSQSLSDDRDSLHQLAAAIRPGDNDLILFTRGWEPPTAELEDFILDALNALPDQRLALVPLATTRRSLTETQLAQWHRLQSRLGQARVIVCRADTAPGEVHHEHG